MLQHLAGFQGQGGHCAAQGTAEQRRKDLLSLPHMPEPRTLGSAKANSCSPHHTTEILPEPEGPENITFQLSDAVPAIHSTSFLFTSSFLFFSFVPLMAELLLYSSQDLVP